MISDFIHLHATDSGAKVTVRACEITAVEERPTGCVVQFLGYSISASIYEKGFRVFKNSENLSKLFPTLREARQFIIDRVNKRRSFFNKR